MEEKRNHEYLIGNDSYIGEMIGYQHFPNEFSDIQKNQGSDELANFLRNNVYGIRKESIWIPELNQHFEYGDYKDQKILDNGNIDMGNGIIQTLQPFDRMGRKIEVGSVIYCLYDKKIRRAKVVKFGKSNGEFHGAAYKLHCQDVDVDKKFIINDCQMTYLEK